jgi:hypothetical protein
MMLAAILAVPPASAESVPEGTAAATTCQVGPPEAQHLENVFASNSYATIWRLYQAYFLRQPDPEGFAYWLDQYRRGLSLYEVSFYFSEAEEFELTYGTLSDAEFMDLIYSNVLCRPRDAAGHAYWVDLLANDPNFGRGELMVQFSESPEYLMKTATVEPALTPLAQATWDADGYQERTITGGYAVEVDYDRVDFSAGVNRCSVASINANWFYTPESPNPQPIGFAVVDGRMVDNGVDIGSRGIFGERWSDTSQEYVLVETWKPQPYPTYNYSSTLAFKGDRVLESFVGNRLQDNVLYVPTIDVPAQWRWAAAGIPMIVNGERKRDVFDPAVRNSTWNYTYNTLRHSFVAFDKDSGKLMFGSTTGMTAFQIADMVQAEGYDDLIKFDGGFSVEYNVAGEVKVAGTPRDVPLWLGIGC